MLHMLGVIAQSSEMFAAQDIADSEPGFEGHRDYEGVTRYAGEFAHGVGGVVEMLEDFETGDGVETTVGKRQGEHGRADARGGRGMGERGGA